MTLTIAIALVITGHPKAIDSKSDEEDSGKRCHWTPVTFCLAQRVSSLLFVDFRMKTPKDFHPFVYCQLYIITVSFGRFLLASCPVFHFGPNSSPSLLNSVKYLPI